MENVLDRNRSTLLIFLPIALAHFPSLASPPGQSLNTQLPELLNSYPLGLDKHKTFSCTNCYHSAVDFKAVIPHWVDEVGVDFATAGMSKVLGEGLALDAKIVAIS